MNNELAGLFDDDDDDDMIIDATGAPAMADLVSDDDTNEPRKSNLIFDEESKGSTSIKCCSKNGIV